MDKLKILIVDDEKPARALLRRTLPWDELGYEICGEARNGQQGFEMYEQLKPDVIITDIEMPVMSGLDLIRKIRETDTEQSFIVLSCYEDFSYARESIQLNVVDYIIKDLLNPKDLFLLLEGIREKLTNEWEKQIIKSSEFSAQIKEKRIITGKKLKEAILRNRSDEVEFIIKMDSKMDYYIFLVSIDDYFARDFKYEKQSNELLKNKYKEMLYSNITTENNVDGVIYTAYMGKGKAFCLVSINPIKSENLLSQKLMKIANHIRFLFSKDEKNHTLSISFGSKFNDPSNLIKQYNEAFNAMQYRMFLGKGKNISTGSVFPKITNISETFIINKVSKIRSALENEDNERVKTLINQLYMENLSGFMQYNFLKEVNGKLFYLLSTYCSRKHVSYKQLFSVNYLPTHLVDSFDTVSEVSLWFGNYFAKTILLSQNQSHYSRHIEDAINYITDNCSSSISLNDISEALNIHKVYLSRLFKEEVGMTLSKYILGERMKIAKDLINQTNLKLYEIAEKVGYTNAQHFIVSFKKNEGITPREYRKNAKSS